MAGYEVGSAYLTILPTTKGFSNALNKDLDGPFTAAGARGGDRMSAGVAKSPGFAAAGAKLGAIFVAAFAAVGGAQIAVAVKDLLVDAVESASDLAETQSKTNQIFGDSSKRVVAFAKTAASALGQSQQTALDGAATFGIFGQSAGLAGDNLADFATEMITLAGDLASFNNTSPEDAITAIGAALRGESEPIRAYGVLLDDATLKNRALALGLITTTKEALTPQQRVLAAHAEILAQTATQQGDFARTSDGLANSQRIFTAELENTKTEIGTALLPVVTDLFHTFAADGVPALQELAAWFSENEVAVRETALALVDGGLQITGVFLTIGSGLLRLEAVSLGVFSFLINGFLAFVEGVINGAEKAFGWVPGLGPKLRDASRNLDALRLSTASNFAAMQDAATATADTFDAGATAVNTLRDAVAQLNGARATVFLNAQGNLVRDDGSGTFSVKGSAVKFRAAGGPVVPGQPYVVGENEPELFVPDRPGHIYNQSQLAGMASTQGGGPTFQVTAHADAPLAYHYAQSVAAATTQAWQDFVAVNEVGAL